MMHEYAAEPFVWSKLLGTWEASASISSAGTGAATGKNTSIGYDEYAEVSREERRVAGSRK